MTRNRVARPSTRATAGSPPPALIDRPARPPKSAGKRKWKGGRYGHGQLVLLSDQDLLLVVSEKGELAPVRAAPDQFTELARFPAIKGDRSSTELTVTLMGGSVADLTTLIIGICLAQALISTQKSISISALHDSQFCVPM